MKENRLEQLKKDYRVLQKKYGLPEFDRINQDFYIEKIVENETQFLIREIRRMVGDRLANYMRFVEHLLNPINVPFFIFSIIKLIGKEEKNKLSEIYQKLVKNEVKFLEVDLEFNEAREAKFVKESFELWQEIKKDLLEIISKIDKGWENKREENSRGYFG